MSGTQIDREAAASTLRSANALIVNLCNSATKLRDSVKNINNKFAAPTVDAPISAMYKKVYSAFDNSMPRLFTELQELNVKILNAINAGAESTGDKQLISWNEVSWTNYNSVFLKKVAGIESFSSVYSEIQTFDSLVKIYVISCNDVINAYKRLYSIAQQGSNSGICDNAHQAAEKIRTYTEKISESLKTFARDFTAKTEVIERNANDSNDQIVETLSRMTETLNATPFDLLKATDLPTA